MSRCTQTPFPGGGVCVDCVAVPGVPGSPGRIETVTVEDWNAGANLVHREEGACVVRWSPTDDDVGLFVGFYPTGTDRNVADPTSLSAAWYVFKSALTLFAVPYSAGARLLDSAFNITSANELSIEHVGAVARFAIDDVSAATCAIFAGPTRVGACLYRSEDAIP